MAEMQGILADAKKNRYSTIKDALSDDGELSLLCV
jgi:hypothetical protein